MPDCFRVALAEGDQFVLFPEFDSAFLIEVGCLPDPAPGVVRVGGRADTGKWLQRIDVVRARF